MDAAAASWRPDDDPSVRRPSLLARDAEQVFLEIRGDVVIVQQRLRAVFIAERSVEDVQRRVIALRGYFPR